MMNKGRILMFVAVFAAVLATCGCKKDEDNTDPTKPRRREVFYRTNATDGSGAMKPASDIKREDWTGDVWSDDNKCFVRSFKDKLASADTTLFDFDATVTEVILPEGLTEVRGKAFSRMPALERVTLPSTVRMIYNYAFADSGIKEFSAPAGLVGLGTNMFTGCGALERISIAPSNIFWSDQGCNGIFSADGTTLMYACRTTAIPDSLHVVYKDAFAGIPLQKVILPGTVVSLGETSFAAQSPGEASIDSVCFKSKVPPVLGKDVFLNQVKMVIRVPDELYDTYAAADAKNGWADSLKLKIVKPEN